MEMPIQTLVQKHRCQRTIASTYHFNDTIKTKFFSYKQKMEFQMVLCNNTFFQKGQLNPPKPSLVGNGSIARLYISIRVETFQ